MMRILMKSKIHNCTITCANLNYEGSITIDEELMKKTNILEGERVQVVNLDNGNRLETYAIAGKNGAIEMNGPAALKCRKGDRIHIISYAILNDAEKIERCSLFLDESNKPIKFKKY